jgi:signal transduction histidine kinase
MPSPRPHPWLAWALGAAALAMVGGLILLIVLDPDPLSTFVRENAFAGVFVLLFPGTGALIASRHPRNAVGWLMMAGPLFILLLLSSYYYATQALVAEPGSLPGGGVASWIQAWAWVPFLFTIPLLLLLIPTGKPVSRRWRWILYLTLADLALLLTGFMATWPLRGPALLGQVEVLPGLSTVTKVALAVSFPVFVVATLAAIASVVVRYVRARGDERQQLKWVVYGVLIVGVDVLISSVVGLPDIVDALAIVPLAVAIPVAILKYRLYDIDVVINKTLVYGAMAVFITAVYVAIVVGIGNAVGGGRNLALSILATALVAVAFQPVRERVQKVANRLVYGKRATPYEVLSEFSEGMAHAVATEELLPRMARIVAEGTGAARVEVWLQVGPDLVREATWPDAGEGTSTGTDAASATVPVRHQGEVLGVIGVTTSTGALTPTERKVLDDLASQAGLVLRNVRLVEELRTSRQRLVAAQDEERRRLERDLHDGAQQRLVAIALALRMARGLADPEADRALGERLEEASTELGLALSELREFARGIHPAILTERGLLPALQALTDRSTVPATLEASVGERLPSAVEAAAYLVASQGISSAARLPSTSEVTVRVARTDGELLVAVEDDGAPGADGPADLQALADRVAAVDGRLSVYRDVGTGGRLEARIPLRVPVEAPT